MCLASTRLQNRAAAIAAGDEVEPEPWPEPRPDAGPETERVMGDEHALPKDMPPDVSRSADVYMLLKNFPRNAEDLSLIHI